MDDDRVGLPGPDAFAAMRGSERFYLLRLHELIGSASLEKLVEQIEPMEPGWHFLDMEIFRQRT